VRVGTFDDWARGEWREGLSARGKRGGLQPRSRRATPDFGRATCGCYPFLFCVEPPSLPTFFFLHVLLRTSLLLSLCTASRMWVRHRSVVIISPRVVWNSRRDSRKRLCFIHVTVENSLGFTLQDCNRVREHTRFLLLTRSTSVEGCCSRIEKEARTIAECTSYTPCDSLSFSSPASLPYSSRHLAL